MKDHSYYVYIMASKYRGILYIGMCSGLIVRVLQHKIGYFSGFTKKYNVYKLVYYEETESIEAAIKREKQIKGGSRQKKIDLIQRMNPQWRDLYEDI